MRITAHSLVPSSPMQYTHLGYLSAQSVPVDAPVASMVLLWVVLAALTIRKSLIWGLAFLLLALLFYACAGLRLPVSSP